MVSKTIKEKIKENPEELIGIELVAKETPNMEEEIDTETKIPNEENNQEKGLPRSLEELSFLCKQASVSNQYSQNLQITLDYLMLESNFIKQGHLNGYRRVRVDKVDYLFVNNFGNTSKRGTYAATVDIKDHEDFEFLLKEYYQKNTDPPGGMSVLGGGVGAFCGAVGGGILGAIVSAVTGDPSIGWYTFYAVWGGSPAIGSYFTYKSYKKTRTEAENEHNHNLNKYRILEERFSSFMKYSPNSYDFSIIKDQLELKPIDS